MELVAKFWPGLGVMGNCVGLDKLQRLLWPLALVPVGILRVFVRVAMLRRNRFRTVDAKSKALVVVV
jgi:hypothetical protein